jgi:hypothetical protein
LNLLGGLSTLNISSKQISDSNLLIRIALDRTLEGLCQPLRQNLDPVLAAQSRLGLIYRVANMIQFYARMIDKTVHGPMSATASAITPSSKTASKGQFTGTLESSSNQSTASRSPLLDYLEELAQNAFSVFYDLLHRTATDPLAGSLNNAVHEMNRRSSDTGRQLELPESDLLPTSSYLRLCEELSEIMQSYESSMVLPLSPAPIPGQTRLRSMPLTPAADREQGFAYILGSIVDPLLQMCMMQADRYPAAPLCKAVFQLNCFTHLQQILQKSPTLTSSHRDLVYQRVHDAEVDVAQKLVMESRCVVFPIS